MNEHELLLKRLRECLENKDGCGVCEYSDKGCGRTALMSATIEALEAYIHPETSGLYDIEEVHENCTVEVWKNSVTGEMSVGWYPDGFKKERPYAS